MKIKTLFFFISICLSSLQARDKNSTSCTHNKPLLQKFIKLTALSFSVAQLAPVIEKIYPHIYKTIQPFFSGQNNNYTPKKLIESVNLESVKKTFLEMKTEFGNNSIKTPKYMLLLLSCKILTNVGLRFIF